MRRAAPVAAAAAMHSACAGIQSTLAPAGREAALIADLFWWMTAGAVVIWIGTIALALYAARTPPERRNQPRDRALLIGGGTLGTTLVLTVLLIFGLALLPPLVQPAPAGSLTVHVIGEQWWWRVRYVRTGGDPIELANEVRLPVGETVQFVLQSDDVIHSFWIPSLAGKMDMIPGRTTYLALQPTATGIFRGVCAEYCGASHALMNFYVEVMAREAFDRWLAHQASPAPAPADGLEADGRRVFFANGCAACHTVAGTPARGVIGPALTHVGSRLSLGAGNWPNDPAAFRRWVVRTSAIKPGAHMPAFDMLPETDLRALIAYLEGLD